MPITQDQLAAAATAIWSGMLGTELEPCSDGCEPDTHLQSCVHISGSWTGAVEIRCSPGLARRLAATMAMAEPDDLAEGDVVDAFGEIANLVGGHVKGLIGGTTSLSCPMVVSGDNLRVAHPRLALLHRAVFRCTGEPLHVTLYSSPGS